MSQTACPLEDLERAAFSTHDNTYDEAEKMFRLLHNFRSCEKLMSRARGVVSEISLMFF